MPTVSDKSVQGIIDVLGPMSTGGGVTSITANSPLTGGGTGTVTLGFDAALLTGVSGQLIAAGGGAQGFPDGIVWGTLSYPCILIAIQGAHQPVTGSNSLTVAVTQHTDAYTSTLIGTANLLVNASSSASGAAWLAFKCSS